MSLKSNSLKELLAPAGNFNSFKAAVNAGADAVYMGLEKFNARVMTNNFTIEEYINAIDYAHKRDVKVYLTLNTLLLDNEVKEAIQNVYELYKHGLDAVIIQDLGVAMLIHKIMPDLPLHASTQMSVYSLNQVRTLEELGFRRVVLARELSIEEIEEIVKNTKLEVEVFVHGALCVSFSGQCLMSALIGSRSANRGNCAGTCRKKYSLYRQDGKCIVSNRYIISKKDIYGIESVKKLIDIGVDSFKIEGRNKTPEYVAGVIREYRKVVDGNAQDINEKHLLQLYNRSGKSLGYLKGVRYRKDISETSPKNTGLALGKVLDVKKEYIKIKLDEDISLHDGIEIIDKSSTIVTCIRDEKFNVINKECKKGSIVWIGDIKKSSIGDEVFKTSDNSLNSSLKEYYTNNLKRLEYKISVIIKKNANIQVVFNNEKIELDFIPEQSKTSALTEEKIKEAFRKTEDTSIRFDLNINLDEGLFVPVSVLNDLRKKTVEFVESKKIIRREIKDIKEKIDKELIILASKKCEDTSLKNILYVYRYNKQMDYMEYYNKKYNAHLDTLYINSYDFYKYEDYIFKYINRCKIYLVIPNVTLKNETKYILENIERLIKKGIYGIVIGNIGYIDLCTNLKEKYNIKLIADYSLNITNVYTALALKKLGFDIVTPLFESDDIDILAISNTLPIELVEDYATVMTMRYCVISSLVMNSKDENICKKECLKNNYYIVDEQNKRYDVVTDNLDCVVKLVRNKKRYDDELKEKQRIRHCVI